MVISLQWEMNIHGSNMTLANNGMVMLMANKLINEDVDYIQLAKNSSTTYLS